MPGATLFAFFVLPLFVALFCIAWCRDLASAMRKKKPWSQSVFSILFVTIGLSIILSLALSIADNLIFFGFNGFTWMDTGTLLCMLYTFPFLLISSMLLYLFSPRDAQGVKQPTKGVIVLSSLFPSIAFIAIWGTYIFIAQTS